MKLTLLWEIRRNAETTVEANGIKEALEKADEQEDYIEVGGFDEYVVEIQDEKGKVIWEDGDDIIDGFPKELKE